MKFKVNLSSMEEKNIPILDAHHPSDTYVTMLVSNKPTQIYCDCIMKAVIQEG